MGWLPKTIYFGRRTGRIHLDNLRHLRRPFEVDPDDIHALHAQTGRQRRQVRGPWLWLLLVAGCAVLVLAWTL